MKLNLTVLMAMFLALSGFTWGSDAETKSSSASTATVNKAKTIATSSMTKSYAPAKSASGATTSGSDRATAIRILTSGDEATRKARLDSLTRVARAMSAKKAQVTPQAATKKKSYQY